VMETVRQLREKLNLPDPSAITSENLAEPDQRLV
jgi:hypothetical protein